MPRPSTIKDEQILDAARAVFLEKGISATTAQVARKAKIAEGSIFNRFPTKRELFQAAMQPQMDDPDFIRLLERRVGRGDLRRTWRDAGAEAIDFFRRVMPLMMMSWSNRDGGPFPKVLSTPDPPPLKGLRRVAAVLDKEMRARRLKRRDPQVLARVFVGSLQNYVFFELLMKANGLDVIPTDRYLIELIDLLWNGAAP